MGIFDSLPSLTSLPSPVDAIPAPVGNLIGVGGDNASLPTYNPQLPSYRSQLVKKYQELGPQYATLPPEAQQSLLDYDAGRVARGQPPLSREQSMGAIQTIVTGKPSTPEPDRNPLSFFTNAVSDIGDVVKSIPRIPSQLFHEIQQLPTAGQHIADAEAHGQNALQALSSAPGIRLIPGAFTVGNIAGGAHGIANALSHPVMTALDVLPFAEGAARATRVGSAAEEAATAAGRSPHALHAILTRTLDEDGNLTRNALGRATNRLQTETKVGQALDTFGGKMSRDAMRSLSLVNGKIRAIAGGMEPITNEAEAAARGTILLNDKYKMTPELAADTHRRLTLDDWHDATPEQLAYRAEYTNLNAQLADHGVAQEELGRIYNPRNPTQPELLPIDQARAVQKAQMLQGHTARMAERNVRAQLGSSRTLDDIAADAHAIVTDENLSAARQRIELRAITHELDAMGYDSKPLLRTLNAPPKFGNNLTNFRDQLQDFAASAPTATPRHTAADLISTFQQYGAAGNRQADRLVQALRGGHSSETLKALRALEQHATRIPELAADPSIAESIRSLASRNKFLAGSTTRYSDTVAAKAAAAADRALDNNVPARFIPRIEQLSRDKLTDLYRAKAATPEEAAGVADLVLGRQWSKLPDYEPGATEKLVQDTTRDIARGWRGLQESGFNPEFVHRVNTGQLSQSLRPTITVVPNTIGQLRERALDASPFEQNATISISHAANEWLRKQGSEEWIDQTIRQYGVNEQELRSAYQGRAAKYMQRFPEASPDAAYQAVMSQTHTPFNPASEGYNWSSARLKNLETDRYWIPKALANNLKAMNDPKGLLGGLIDPVTKLFRVSVIGLSPRTQLYNIMGGATMAMGEVGFTGLVKHLRTGMEYARNPEAMLQDERISAAIRASLGSEKELFGDMDRARFTGRIGDGAEFMKGRALGKVWQQIQDAKALGKVRDAGGKLIKASYNLNGLFDDAYKITTYLTQHDKALTKGLSKDAAELSGLELMRKTQPDWAGMTPIERNLMKSVFPFYGFMQHSIRYVMRYPMDHPLRANILASFARAEQEDNATLPGNFLSNLFITGQNSNGRATALSLAALNPFGDVANTLSLAGWISATNPLLQTAFEQVGLTQGKADLYPTLRYDPESGRLTAEQPNFFQALAGNTIPQTQIASALLGVNQDFKDRLAQDPWSAYRTLISNAGLPILTRGINIPQEQAKAEVAREKSAASVLNAARKSGDWSEAMRYPSLSAYIDQIRALTPEQLAPYQARPDEARQLEAAVKGQQGAAAAVPVTAPIAPVANTGGF